MPKGSEQEGNDYGEATAALKRRRGGVAASLFMMIVLSAAAGFGELHSAAVAQTGMYSASQAERGLAVYTEHCSSCHGASLRGGVNELAAPPLAGPFFLEKWSGRPLEDLYLYTVDSMPPDEPRLADASYVDIVAYLLQFWKYPAGDAELSAESPVMKRPIERQP